LHLVSLLLLLQGDENEEVVIAAKTVSITRS
jgi:hypothetical protein